MDCRSVWRDDWSEASEGPVGSSKVSTKMVAGALVVVVVAVVSEGTTVEGAMEEEKTCDEVVNVGELADVVLDEAEGVVVGVEVVPVVVVVVVVEVLVTTVVVKVSASEKLSQT